MVKLIELIEKAVGSFSHNAFCRKAGISAGNFSRILKGQRVSPEVLRKIAAASTSVTYDQLMQAAGYTTSEKKTQAQRIPVYGSVAAGSPIEAEEDLSGYIYLDYAQKHFGDHCFALKVIGDSMDLANMPDGCTVIVQPQQEIRDGEIAAIRVNGQVTVKRIYHQDEHLVLAPASRSSIYRPQIYSTEEDISILGKVVLALVDIG